jgi:hypothetical protein
MKSTTLESQVNEMIDVAMENAGLAPAEAVLPEATEPTLESKQTIISYGTATGDLTKKTNFLQVSFSLLGSERAAPGTEHDIKTDADKTLLKVKKQLFVSPQYKKIRSMDARMKRKIDKLCVQGALKGVRTVPRSNVGKVFKMCTEYEVIRKGLVLKFVEVYPALFEAAKTQLGGLHRSTDYPSPDMLKANPDAYFAYTYEYVTFDVPGTLAEIDPVMYQQQLGTRTQRLKCAEEEINKVRRATFAALLGGLKESLSPGEDGAEKKFNAKEIKKLQKFIDEYDVMDVTTDEELKALKLQCGKLITGVTSDNVKSSTEFKASLLKGVSELSDLLKPLVEEQNRTLKEF